MLYENISLIMPDEPRYELNKKSDDLRNCKQIKHTNNH